MSVITLAHQPIRPFLKWAGGKTQLLSAILAHLPQNYGRYIEPFIGGGALFFHLQSRNAVISDSNPELINCYKVVRNNVEDLITLLSTYPNDKSFYYELRQTQPAELSPVEKAARLIYLNKTCYNGLYRVNKQGAYNVPFGSYKNPTICDAVVLREASNALTSTVIEEGDYRTILNKYACPGDLVYLDPPYQPVSSFSDFRRYTKEFFYEDDQEALAKVFEDFVSRGIWVILTNSNTELTRRLYQQFEYEIVDTNRYINCRGDGRRSGQDLIVFATRQSQKTKRPSTIKSATLPILERFPGTRFMGSKYSVLDFIGESIKDLKFKSALDAFSGSACVSYLFKSKGKQVYSNDYLHFCYHTANALVANGTAHVSSVEIEMLLSGSINAPTFIRDTFKDLYFSDQDNEFLDNVRARIDCLVDSYKRSIALAALVRACLKKRPRGIFTYTGNRYDDNRRDIRIDLRDHFINSLNEFNDAVFDNGFQNKAFNCDVFDLDVEADLVYLDPPYFSTLSDNDYVRRYHFLEGLVRYWNGIEIQAYSKTKKFRRYPSAFDSRESAYAAFPRLFEKFKDSIIVLSYSSNSIPNKSELAYMLKQFKSKVSVYQVGHQYSFGTQYTNEFAANDVDEYVFVAV
jgi:DNA adenine methylase